MNANREPSDEELDGLFRQAADGLRPRFDPEDWRGMSDRLDAAKLHPRPWWQHWGWLSLATALLFLSGGGVWWQATKTPGTPQTEGRVAAVSPKATTGQRAVPAGAEAGLGKPSDIAAAPRQRKSPGAVETDGAALAIPAGTGIEHDRAARTPRPTPTETSAKAALGHDRPETTPDAQTERRTGPRNVDRAGLPNAGEPATRRPAPGGAVVPGALARSGEKTRRLPPSGQGLRKIPMGLSRTDNRANRFRLDIGLSNEWW